MGWENPKNMVKVLKNTISKAQSNGINDDGEVPEAFFKDMYDKGYLQCVSGYWGFRNEIIAKQHDSDEISIIGYYGHNVNGLSIENIRPADDRSATGWYVKLDSTSDDNQDKLKTLFDVVEHCISVGPEVIDSDEHIYFCDGLKDEYRASTRKSLTQNEQDIYDAIKSKYTAKSHDKIKAKVIKSGYTEQEFNNVISYINKEGGSAGAGSGGASGGSMGTSTAGASNTVYGKKPKEQVYTSGKKKSDKKGVNKSFRQHDSQTLS